MLWNASVCSVVILVVVQPGTSFLVQKAGPAPPGLPERTAWTQTHRVSLRLTPLPPRLQGLETRSRKRPPARSVWT